MRFETKDGESRLVLTAIEKLDEPESLLALRETVAALLPRVEFPELLLEIHVRTGFLDEFTHVSETDARVGDLAVSLCAVLVGEDQLSALGLVVNVVVLWNTICMNAVLEHLRRGGTVAGPEDVGHLSPLEHQHINFLGEYSFALADPVARGELRPLRDPAESLALA